MRGTPFAAAGPHGGWDTVKKTAPNSASVRPTYFPSATASLFRRTFFERVGPFEEGFFAYLEDVDLGLRAAIEDLAGLYVPQAVAYHRGSATSGAWSSAMVEWITCHQLLLLAKFYPTRLLMLYARPILAAQLLWAGLAVSRGGAWAWMRGLWLGIRRFARLRRTSRALRRGERLATHPAFERGGHSENSGSDKLGRLLEMVLPAGAAGRGELCMKTDVAVVVVTYNSARSVAGCLRSLRRSGRNRRRR